jgi:PAS domain S-box-containing protein
LLPEELPMQIAAARGVEVLDFECDVVHDDGTVVKLLEYAAPLFDEEGKTTGCVGAFLDITERTRAAEALRESQERLAGIVASAMDAIISVDEEQRILVFNAAAERMFRCRAEEMLGQPIDRLIPERFRAIHAEHIRHFGRTGVTSRSMTSPGTLTALRADGEEFPIEATISQVLVGHQKLFTVILRDVTERVQAEEALRRQAEELARVDRAKDQFLAMLAHELRNPIGAISNATQLQKLLAPAEPRVARALEIIERQVTHTRRLLDDLLNVSRIARGKISLNPIYLDLTWIVRDTAEDFRSEIEASGLSLSLDLPSDPVWVEGDPTRLAQALGNLLSNAVKFTERGGRITVQLTVDPGTRRAVVTVRDTGCGIAPEVLPHIFETFAQADRNRGGLGLGLPLVKGLVELHGGEVRSESEGVGRGAAFTILLPLAPAEAARHPDPGPAADPVEPKRILVVEDNPDVAKSLCTLLELLGCEVAVAYSGPEAMTLVPRFRPEIVFCDLGLPGMSGYEVATALQQEQATAPPRLIAVSGYGQEEDKRRARDAGFERHLTKPVDLEELRRVLSTHST